MCSKIVRKQKLSITQSCKHHRSAQLQLDHIRAVTIASGCSQCNYHDMLVRVRHAHTVDMHASLHSVDTATSFGCIHMPSILTVQLHCESGVIALSTCSVATTLPADFP